MPFLSLSFWVSLMSRAIGARGCCGYNNNTVLPPSLGISVSWGPKGPIHERGSLCCLCSRQCFDRKLFRAFPSFYFLIWCDFDGISHAKPCLKSRNFASLQQLKFKSRSFKFFWMGSGPETVHFLPCNLAKLLLTSCMVNPPQTRKVRNSESAIKMCSCWCMQFDLRYLLELVLHRVEYRLFRDASSRCS